MKKYITNEDGFSLLELTVAAAIAVILSTVAIVGIPNLIERTNSTTDAYEACGLQRENEIQSVLDGQDPNIQATCSPTPSPTP